MCTVSLIYTEDSVRLACNRDESITRHEAHPPRLLRFGAQTTLMPTDPQGGGTWVAANSSGLIFALLNNNPTPVGAASTGRQSRGKIIPQFAACESIENVLQHIRITEFNDYAPFRLLVAERETWVQAIWDRRWLQILKPDHDRQSLMVTSSGLGDSMVDFPRRRLFITLLSRHSDPLLAQETFHNHTWPEAGWLSVKMKRDDAKTVSQTIIDLSSSSIQMTYTSAQTGVSATSQLVLDLGMFV